MSIDDMLGRDPRLMKLAKLLGWSRRETVGCLVMDVWPVCYDRVSHVLGADEIDIAAGFDGFTEHMISSGLATRTRSGIRITGAKKRIEYIEAKREAGRAGGLKSGETRRIQSKQKRSTASNDCEAPGNPILTLTPTVPDQEEDCSPSARPPSPQLELVKAKVDKHTSSHQAVIAAWTDRFKSTHGAAPTWPGKNAAAVKSLLKSHPVEEITRRMTIAFEHPLDFPPQPWDFATFASQFDKLAQVAFKPKSAAQPPPRNLQEL